MLQREPRRRKAPAAREGRRVPGRKGRIGGDPLRQNVEHFARLRDLQGGLARHAVPIHAPGRDRLRRKAEPVGQRDLAGEIAVGERAEPRVEPAERDDRVAPEHRAAGEDPVVDPCEQRTRARGVDEAGAAQRPDRRAHADRAAGEAVDQQGLAAEQAGCGMTLEQIARAGQEARHHVVVRRGEIDVAARSCGEPARERRHRALIGRVAQDRERNGAGEVLQNRKAAVGRRIVDHDDLVGGLPGQGGQRAQDEVPVIVVRQND